MARKRSPHPTDAELRLLQVLWQKGPATVSDIVSSLQNELAYNTVLTMMTILEKKGFVRHEKEKESRAFVYYPMVDQRQAGRSAIQYILSRFFNNSPELLVLNLLENEGLDPEELKRLRAIIEQSD